MDELMRKDLSVLAIALVVGLLFLSQPALLSHPIAIPSLALAGLAIWVALRPAHAGLRSYALPVSLAIVIGLVSAGTLF